MATSKNKALEKINPELSAQVKSLERHKKTLGRKQLKSWGMSTKYADRPDLLKRKH